MTKAQQTIALVRKGGLSPREIQKAVGFRHVCSVYRACYDADIPPPVSHRARNSGDIRVFQRWNHRKCTSTVYVRVEALRAAGLDKESRLAFSAEPGRIVITRKGVSA
jgi:hypothetical protein